MFLANKRLYYKVSFFKGRQLTLYKEVIYFEQRVTRKYYPEAKKGSSLIGILHHSLNLVQPKNSPKHEIA